MARPLRIEYPGGLYHVTSRGNARQNIFLNVRDRLAFLDILSRTVKTHNWLCHAYCLMNNHYHLLIETPDGNLSAGMRDLNGIYTQNFNRHHHRIGHVLQGRFKSFIIEKETYLLEVARYVVLNPVRTKTVDHPRKWQWSSYLATAGEGKTPGWLQTDWLLGLFGKTRYAAQRKYRSFIVSGIGARSPFNDVQEGCVIGSKQFMDWIWEKAVDVETIKEIPRSNRLVSRPSLAELFDDTRSKDERDAAIRLARFRCGYLTTEIAKFIKLDRSTIGKISRSVHGQ